MRDRNPKMDEFMRRVNGSDQFDVRNILTAVEHAMASAPQIGIRGFFGPYRFLSNFHYVDVEFEGLVYPTTEHAYQAAKSHDEKVRRYFAEGGLAPREVRRLGQEIVLDPEWHTTIKFDVMLELTRKKYAKDPLRSWLLDTGDNYLEETNHWGDVCWGVCNGVGENNLGKTLMLVRKEIMEGRTHGA